MSRVKVDFYGPVPQLIEKSRNRITNTTGNPNFPLPNPTMADVTTATDDVETAYLAALNGDREKKAILRAKVRVLRALQIKFADYVQTESGGDELIILSSGFPVRKTPSAVPAPETPQTVSVKPAVHEGQLEIFLKPSTGAVAYIYRMYVGSLSATPVMLGASLKSKFIARNLTTLTRYWFQVMALNAGGMSGWSDPAMGVTL